MYSDMGTGYGLFVYKRQVQAGHYADTGLWPGTTYQYRVAAHASPPGAAIAATTLEQISQDTQRVVFATPRRAFGAVMTATLSATPAALPTSTSTPTPVPADTILLGLMSSNDYTDDLGNVVIVGEVRNDSTTNASQALVVITFYDARGEIIQREEARPMINILKPGQRSPFVLSIPKPLNLWEWSLRATARPTAKEPRTGLIIRKSRSFEEKTGFYHVVGKVYNDNNTRSSANLAQVVVTLYDKYGKIVNAGFAYTEPLVIPGATEADFDCSFSYFYSVKDYLTQVEWE